MEVITHTNQWRIEKLQILTGLNTRYHADLQRAHFGTNRLSEMRERIIQLRPSFSSKRYEPWEKFYNDYLEMAAYDVQNPAFTGPVNILAGQPIGFMNLGITYANPVT